MKTCTLAGVALCITTLGCHGDEPKLDEDGCWVDGEEAYVATLEASCEAGIHCHPELDSSTTVQSCIDYDMQFLEERRESMCFDGCAVQSCLDRIAEYREACGGLTAVYDACYDETFYDGLEKECVQRPW